MLGAEYCGRDGPESGDEGAPEEVEALGAESTADGEGAEEAMVLDGRARESSAEDRGVGGDPDGGDDCPAGARRRLAEEGRDPCGEDEAAGDDVEGGEA